MTKERSIFKNYQQNLNSSNGEVFRYKVSVIDQNVDSLFERRM